jgi:hypothetical protein
VTARRWRGDEVEQQRTGLGPLFDKPLPYAKGSDTSLAAANAMHDEASIQRAKVLGLF